MSNDLKVGDRIKDNDPRMWHRVLTVELLTATHAWTSDGYGRKHGIALCRIYTDGKPRRSGFSKVMK